MKKLLVIVLSGMIFGTAVIAQDAEKEAPKYGWTESLVGNLNFTQTSLSNWSAGGDDNWNWQLDLNGKAVNDQEKINWTNAGKISYGQTKIADQSSRKSADEIRLESVLAYKLGTLINPYVAVTGISQLTSSYAFSEDANGNEVKTEISKFLNPGFFTESFGIAVKPIPEFQTRLGLAFKQTVATDTAFAPAYSDDPETAELEKVRSEVGLESVSDYERKLAENILYKFKLEMFSDLSAIKDVDVRWDNVISAKVSKLIAVSFNLQLFYDSDISIQRQLKQVLAVGLTYSFL